MCKLKTEVDKSVIDAKDELLHDLSSAHVRGLVNDVTFICNDGVKLSSNKSLLSVRSPFFNSMMFGGFKNTVEEEIEFKSSNSEVLKHILDYIWLGSMNLKSLEIKVLLGILECSRMLCLDTLVKGVENYLIHNIKLFKFNHDELLETLDFAITHKFDALLNCTLATIDKILGKVIECSRFHTLKESSILAILTFDMRTSVESAIFEAFLGWIKHNEGIAESTITEMLNAFELKKFDKAYLLNKVRKTGYFEFESIFDVLEEKVAEAEKKLHDTESTLNDTMKDIGVKNQQISSLKKLYDTKNSEIKMLRTEMQKWDDANMNKFYRSRIVEAGSSVSSILSRHKLVFRTQFGTINGLAYAFSDNEFINNIQFDVDSHYSRFSYSIESSLDGNNWKTNAEFSHCEGKQNVYFPMQEMVYLYIKLNRSDISVKKENIVLLLDTESGERRNKTN